MTWALCKFNALNFLCLLHPGGWSRLHIFKDTMIKVKVQIFHYIVKVIDGKDDRCVVSPRK